jgi:hypothetical protein
MKFTRITVNPGQMEANDLVGQRIEHAMNTPSNRIRPPRPIESSQRK